MKHSAKDSAPLLSALCQALKARRQLLGISQTELGRRANLHRGYINDVEGGTRNLSIETLCRLAAALEISVSAIIACAESEAAKETTAFHVLVVEGNAADVYLIKMALTRAGAHLGVAVVEDGRQAMEYIRRQGPYKDEPMPDLVLLDLNLATKNGYDVLAEIKGDRLLKHIPVIVLTPSSSTVDIQKSYELHANSLVIKPLEPDAFQDALQRIVHYWLQTAQLPTPNRIGKS